MKTVKLSSLSNGQIFLTRSSKLYRVEYYETDGFVMVSHYTDSYHKDLLKGELLVYPVKYIE